MGEVGRRRQLGKAYEFLRRPRRLFSRRKIDAGADQGAQAPGLRRSRFLFIEIHAVSADPAATGGRRASGRREIRQTMATQAQSQEDRRQGAWLDHVAP